MDPLHFTIGGSLAIPGLVRVPPPFGPPRDAVRAILAAQARLSREPMHEAQGAHLHPSSTQWRRRMTVVAAGVACTVTAALIGSYTGQHRQPVFYFDQAQVAAIAQPSMPPVPLKVPLIEATHTIAPQQDAAHIAVTKAVAEAAPEVPVQPAVAASDTPAASIVPDAPSVDTPPLVKPPGQRALAWAKGRKPTPAAVATVARPATLAYAEPKVVDSDHAMSNPAAIISSHLTPGTSARIALQRHTRLTD